MMTVKVATKLPPLEHSDSSGNLVASACGQCRAVIAMRWQLGCQRKGPRQ